MMVLLVATLGLVVAAALAFWPSWKQPAEQGRSTRSRSGMSGHAEPRAPLSLEGVLVTQLIAGEISRPQYLRALEQLAARDEQRHPLALPD
ncbi:hypothetical protein [Actinoplanes utahensis]|nr:hypothetical protein [Actinoplanes utahensis]GIF27473.1 hypothetical protein Aut01nite_04590 [Actinoplanes utahensis]